MAVLGQELVILLEGLVLVLERELVISLEGLVLVLERELVISLDGLVVVLEGMEVELSVMELLMARCLS